MSDSGDVKESVGTGEKEEKTEEEASGSGKGRKAKRSGSGGGFRRFVFLCFYIVFLAAVVLAALALVEYYAYLQVKGSVLGQAYKGKDLDLARRSSQKVAPLFGYEPTPGFAAVRNTKLGNSPEFINEQSFKDFENVPLDKPKDEYRVFVTGGSVIYGRGPVPPADAVCDYYEVTYRWNIPHIMEQLLNADPRVREKIGGKKVRVINAGVAGHVIQNDLMRYLAKLRLYRPDLVVSLDGANEVPAVARTLKDWNYFTEGQYYEVVSEILDMSWEGLRNYVTLWLKRNTYLFTWLAMKEGEGPGILMENRGFAVQPMDPTPEMLKYRDRNIDQVADVLAIYNCALQADGIPHVFALQPMFRNSKKKRMPIEMKIEQITGMDKVGFFDAVETYDMLVDRIKKRGHKAGFEVVDLTGIFDNVSEWVFTDWCHLTNGANFLLAKSLVNEVKTRVFGLELLPSDKITPPLDSYFTDYSKTAKVLVNGAVTDRGLHVLKGYPTKEVLDVKPSNNPGVVVDLGKVVPISRFRIVWGDKESVPAGWKAQLSEDGKAWNDWIVMEKTETDPFDQWPGFEYYATKETPARYLRYVQTGDDAGKEIRLRQLSLFR